MEKLLQFLDRLKKSRKLNPADKQVFIPVIDLLKGMVSLGLTPTAQQRAIIANRVKQTMDTLDYIGESNDALQLQLILLEL